MKLLHDAFSPGGAQWQEWKGKEAGLDVERDGT
jgi:hypothetical protein